MLALQVTAIFFVLLSATLMFGPQLVIYGPRALAAAGAQRTGPICWWMPDLSLGSGRDGTVFWRCAFVWRRCDDPGRS